jgi:aminoglycoside 3-N-acetyltransferase
LDPTKRIVCDLLSEIGILSGDTVFVHSDTQLAMYLFRADWLEECMELLLKSFEEVLGPSGTLVVPTFNYDFCNGKPYNHQKTLSQVGKFTNYILQQPDMKRSLHPIFSCAAIGADADICDNVSKSAFGKISIFDRLNLVNAKIVFFGCPFERCTFIHYVEQSHGVKYRFLKDFTGTIINNNREYTDTFDFLVRDLDGDVEVYLGKLEQRLRVRGYLTESIGIMQVSARDIYNTAYTMLNEDHYCLLAHHPGDMD